MPKKKPIIIEVELQRYEINGEKTGWTFIEIPQDIAVQMSTDRRGFRVKGKMDDYVYKQVALVPIKGGNFILPINAQMRKATGKKDGDWMMLEMSLDPSEIPLSQDLRTALSSDLDSINQFESLTPSHQQYFSKWVESAKTMPTKSDRIAKCLFAMQYKMDYGQMIRHFKKEK